jgi:hypothetical protein
LVDDLARVVVVADGDGSYVISYADLGAVTVMMVKEKDEHRKSKWIDKSAGEKCLRENEVDTSKIRENVTKYLLPGLVASFLPGLWDMLRDRG